MLGDSRGSKKKSRANGLSNGDAMDDVDSDEAMEDNEMEEDESVHTSDDEEEDDDNDPEEVVARTASGQIKGSKGRNERVMSAGEVRSHLRVLFHKERELAMLLYGRHGGPKGLASKTTPIKVADMFFLDVIPVSPTRFRPPARMGDELFENAQNSLLSAVITTSIRIGDLTQRLRDAERAERGELVFDAIQKTEAARAFPMLLEALVKLQNDVNSFMDSSKNPAPMRQGKLPPPGVKQLLEKKEGLFRKHMMVS
jgi:DNA-directed RNA polymerase I subunit RPA1